MKWSNVTKMQLAKRKEKRKEKKNAKRSTLCISSMQKTNGKKI